MSVELTVRSGRVESPTLPYVNARTVNSGDAGFAINQELSATKDVDRLPGVFVASSMYRKHDKLGAGTVGRKVVVGQLHICTWGHPEHRMDRRFVALGICDDVHECARAHVFFTLRGGGGQLVESASGEHEFELTLVRIEGYVYKEVNFKWKHNSDITYHPDQKTFQASRSPLR